MKYMKTFNVLILEYRRIGFNEITELIRNSLGKEDTLFREGIPNEKRVAISIWRLFIVNFFRTMAKSFVAKPTVISITNDFCFEMMSLAKYFIKFPSAGRQIAKAISKLKDTTSCKNHRLSDLESNVDYYNRKQQYSTNSQAFSNVLLVLLEVYMTQKSLLFILMQKKWRSQFCN